MKARQLAMQRLREARAAEQAAEARMKHQLAAYEAARSEYLHCCQLATDAERAARKVPPGSVVEVLQEYRKDWTGLVSRGLYEVTGGDGKRLRGRRGVFPPDCIAVIWTPHDETPRPTFVEPSAKNRS